MIELKDACMKSSVSWRPSCIHPLQHVDTKEENVESSVSAVRGDGRVCNNAWSCELYSM